MTETAQKVDQYASYKVRTDLNSRGEKIQLMRLDLGTGETESPAAGSVPMMSAAFAMQVNDLGNGTMYVGEALPGTAAAAAAWRIKKIVTSGADVSITWADGNANFDNVWSNRAGLTYS